MNKCLVLLITLFSLFLFVSKAEAKTLPQALKAGQKTTVVRKNVGAGINVSVKLRADRRAVIVYFSNLQNASLVSYFLTYKTDVQEEGAMGGIKLTGSSTASQELLFGTCSNNVCRYHTGIKIARLEVSYTAKSGKKYLKKYKIKV
ncbi:hypothetical protein A3C26_01820 [Candidatus Daviesbacteria bacterium RIFCSPHIGHO2_02_FULL_39_12]|uniref:Uncharacterized protein n=2 Tax=Candidatus Daviesiibacteriota TaxID=1752718 RepID=A0A1F5JAY1_9BACT|nr:MAG: hypothetical protein A3C26_01820 [Candidatus Daviesbacteria bacterium RIFCSPHIGHO2_02_FULL_39_12]OGE72710.1 MAG: hypothetical protein A3H40_00145 [Candidatus Daviesbacteria bacterium RIFCSPLOWO2_02_FULL_38_15]